MAAVRTFNLTKKFDDLVAVNDLNLLIEQGEIFGFVGPDGAGKTTTLRLLTTILKPTTGQGWIFDKDVVKDSEAIKEDIA
jgi:ABC-2 type transport system ATP-binding protein